MGRHYVSEAVVRFGFFDASLKKSGVNDSRRSPTEAFKCVSLRCILENQKEHFGFLPLQKCVYRGWKKTSFWKTPFVRKLWTHHSPSRLAAATLSPSLYGGVYISLIILVWDASRWRLYSTIFLRSSCELSAFDLAARPQKKKIAKNSRRIMV